MEPWLPSLFGSTAHKHEFMSRLKSEKKGVTVTHLCHGAEARVGLGGADLQRVEVVSALVVDGPGEAERAAVLVDAEQVPRVHQQHVGQTLLLEGDGLNQRDAAPTQTTSC